MKKKMVLVLFVILVLCSGCWSSREINTLAISIATGIDKTDQGYRVTQQVLNPTAVEAKYESNKAPVILFTGEGENIFSAIRKMTMETPRKIYNAHVNIVVLGEDMAKNGIKDILDLFMRDHEYRTDFYIAVAKGTTAQEALGILTPLDSVPGIKLHRSLEIAETHFGAVKGINIIDLVQFVFAEGQEPVLPGIEITPGREDSDSLESLRTVSKVKRLRYTGLGVFCGDKLVGWLSEEESKGYQYIVNNVKNNMEYAWYNEKDQVTYEVIRSDTKMNALATDGKATFVVEIKTMAAISAMEGEMDISKEENRIILTDLLEKRIQSLCEAALERAQNQLHSDIFGFGEVVRRKCPELWNQWKKNCGVEFANLPVNFKVTVELEHMGSMTNSLFGKDE